MRSKGYQNYFDDEVLNASPVQLVQMLYRGVLDSIASARRHLRLGDIRSRSRSISKAIAILTELAGSLDSKQGGELSRNLAQLYDYVQRLLIQANIEQRDKPLVEAEQLVSKLAQAWDSFTAERTGDPSPTNAVIRDSYQPVSCAY
ncbi:MAG TPA: flagellar export chaperone FliS [Bryobacteraceae bacterium]|nr:flagellar export chaperone FliS [Bryobacteraceae bacterium]